MADDDIDTKPLPVVKGDWIESREYNPRVGRVVDSYWKSDADGGDPLCMVDVAIYAISGNKVGRESPAMGGPRTYEPWLSYSEWFRIAKPAFPLKLLWVPDADVTGQVVNRYVTDANRLGDRTEGPRKRKRPYAPRSIPKPDGTDYDPELEVRTRRMAAQQLRDINRASPAAALLEKAEALEAEASSIAREHRIER